MGTPGQFSSMGNLLIDKDRKAMSPSDPQGRVALMLCESVLHVLIEEGVLTKAKAIEAIETVVELTREIAEVGPPDITNHAATHLVEAIAESFALKDCP
jgi:hypothetical protein